LGHVVTDEIGAFVRPERVFSRDDVLAFPSPVPFKRGVYGWWFRRLPPRVVASSCCRHQDLTLLYAGMSHGIPPTRERPASTQTLPERIRYHYLGDAEGSELRRTLGCLLAGELGIELRRVGTGERMTFVEGEHTLSAWMAENAYVSWIVYPQPWNLKDNLTTVLDLPLNLWRNKHNQFHSVLTEVRAKCVARARDLPVLPDPDIDG
jgi:hypothetical protein